MCTAIACGGFVGRNLDIYEAYGEEIIVTPRKYCIAFRKEENHAEHCAIIGMGTVLRGYPLYYDAANEHGLYVAGLNYVGNAHYRAPCEGYINLAPFELIPYLLTSSKTVREAREKLKVINLTDIPFSRELPNAKLHWLIADEESVIVAEPDEDGINIYDNPVGVLTNNPPFPLQLFNLNNYAHLKTSAHDNTFLPNIRLSTYSEGMGALGLCGDLSSQSRFVRAAFHRAHAHSFGSISDLFHLLSSVEMPDGSVTVKNSYERTEYTSGVDLSSLTYYYRHYESAAISAVHLLNEELDSHSLIRYQPLKCKPVSQN